MACNRKLPFGYRMEQGEIKEHPVEAEAVRRIFRRYLAGASYAALVEHLRDTGPAYDEDKPWNKNMVARILENGKYTGGSGFPAVIPPEVYQKTLTQRKERAAPPTKTPAQKELRRLCCGNPPQYVEGQVLGVLNRLAANTSLIRTLDPPEDEPVQIRVLHRKLTDLLKEAPVDEAAARRTALDLAAQRWTPSAPRNMRRNVSAGYLKKPPRWKAWTLSCSAAVFRPSQYKSAAPSFS